MKCSSEIPIESCQWQSPEGQSFSMRDLPQGYKSIIDNEKTCHIMIEKLETAQLGKWSCIVRQKGQKQYQQAYMTATEVVPVTDVRLPTHADPESYVIHLTPFIIEGNYSIEGNLTLVDVEILRYSTKFPSKSFFFISYFCKLFKVSEFYKLRIVENTYRTDFSVDQNIFVKRQITSVAVGQLIILTSCDYFSNLLQV